MKKKIIIFFIIVFIILIIGITIVIKYLQDNPEVILEQKGEAGEIIDYENQEVQKVTDFGKFYTVINCVNTYIDKININNSSYYGTDENDNYTIIVSNENINKNIYDLLSKDYINDKGITIENLKNKTDTIEQKAIFVPLKMNVIINNVIEKYVVYGFTTDINSNFIKEMYLYINLDITNKTFSIEPIENKEIKSIDEIEIINNNKSIEKNDNNNVVEAKINNEYLCQRYMDYYKKILLASPKLAYKYLDNDYKEKRFGDYETFKKYLQDNKEKIVGINLKEYLVEYYDEYSEYVCKDKYDNLYIFDEKGILDYTIKLDTYTIPTEKFKETYEKAEDYKKVQMNIDKFFQMINRQDYTNAYNCLAQSYRNNYFKTEEDFIKYAKNNFFTYNKISFQKNEQKGEGLYVFKVRLEDITGQSTEKKETTVIMQLYDNFEFEMSFGV
mgnify:CR=1 FL=1